MVARMVFHMTLETRMMSVTLPPQETHTYTNKHGMSCNNRSCEL